MTDSRVLNALARQERVKLLLSRNLTLPEIAEAVGASLRTVNYDVKNIRQEAAKNLSVSNVLDLAATMLLRSEARHRELWSLFARANAAERDGLGLAVTITLKLNLLKELARQTSRELEILLKLGIVIPAEKETMLDMKAVTLLNSLPPGELERALTQDTEQFLETLRVNLGDIAMTELFGGTWSSYELSEHRSRTWLRTN